MHNTVQKCTKNKIPELKISEFLSLAWFRETIEPITGQNPYVQHVTFINITDYCNGIGLQLITLPLLWYTATAYTVFRQDFQRENI